MRRFVPGWALKASAVAAMVVAILSATACALPGLPKNEVSVSPQSGDAYKALKDAVDQVKDGGTVRLGAGTYKLSESLRIVKSVKLVGEGVTKTKIVGSSGEAVVEINGHADVSVEGVAFTRAGEQSGDVVEVVAGSGAFRACAFSGGVAGEVAGGNGLAFYNDAKGVVEDCVVADNWRSGIHVQDTAEVTLTGNTCEKNEEAGIAFLGRSKGTAEGNTCQKNQLDGIHVQDAARPMLVKNKCYHNRQAGIMYLGTAGGMASQNKIVENAGSGISVGEKAAPELLTNTITKSPYCIAYYDSAAGVARGNTCVTRGTSNIGIAVFDKARPKLVDNKSSVNLTS